MIAPLPGWSWTPTEDGVVLAAPASLIRYRERVRPLLSIAELVHAECADSPVMVERLIGPEWLTTDEGEYAAIVTAHAHLNGEPVRRTLGFVFGDDFYAHISGLAIAERAFEQVDDAVRRLVRSDTHLLGVRRRRYRYVAPAGWHAAANPSIFHDYWCAPDGAARITVYPCLPLDRDDDLVAALEPDGVCEPVRTAALEGQSWTSATRKLVVLRDRTYAYALAIDGVAASPDFERVVASIEPIPPRVVTNLAAFQHWGA